MEPSQADSERIIVPGKRVLYLAFHKLISNFSFSVTNYKPDRFSKFLEYVSGFDQTKVILTFDDGYAHLRNKLPELMQRFDFIPIIFFPTSLIGKEADWDYSYRLRKLKHLDKAGIKELAELGVRFGSHGHSHTDLTSLSMNQLIAELKDSRAILEDLTGNEISEISYPFGRQNRIVRQLASEVGFNQGYTMSFPEETDHPLAVGRLPIYGYDNSFSIMQKINRGAFYPLEKLKARVTNYLSGGTVLLNRIRRYQS